MSTDAQTTRRPIWRRWLDFWFAPADPTPFGFIRIVTGCLVVYVHLAYSFDLQNFFGANGWYGLDYSNRERHEVPHIAPPLEWADYPRTARVPEFPHRRQAVMNYLHDLLAKNPSRGQMEAALQYIEKLQGSENNALVQNALLYLKELSPDPKSRVNQLEVLKDESKRKAMIESQLPRLVVPDSPFVAASLNPADRALLAADAEAFYKTLPTSPDDRAYVIDHLAELDLPGRSAFVDFLKELSTLDEAERARRLEFLEYWNTEARVALRLGNPIFSQWFHITDPTNMAIAHGVILVIMVCFTVGFCTRVMGVLTWLAAVGYIHRTNQVLFGMDTMMNILLFYLMIGNSGAALSVDRLINRYRAIRASLQRCGTIDAATRAYLDRPPHSVATGFALRMLQVHFCFIYMAAGLSKLKGAAWWNTNAYWDTLVNPEFTLIHYHWYESLVRSAVSSRPVYACMAAFGVGFTLFAEISLPFLVWTRVRPWIVICGLMLHAGVAVFMGLWIFSLLMMTMLLAYLPGAAFRYRLFGTSTAKERLTLKLNERTGPPAQAAALVRTFDFDDRVEIVEAPARNHGGGLQVEVAGSESSGSQAASTLCSHVSGLRPFRWLLVIPGLSSWMVSCLTGTRSSSPVKPGPSVTASR